MKILSILFALFFSGVSFAHPLNNIVVFGDSLSDNGNLYKNTGQKVPRSPPYYEGRFTNGLVWVEHLITSYFPEDPHAHLLNYAFGGAGVSEDEEDEVLFTLKREIDMYLIDHQGKADVNSLFIVWIGANNYFNVSSSEAEQTLADVKLGITHGLEHLLNAGAKHILVLNIPDLGQSPVAFESDAQEILSYLSRRHNELLLETLAELEAIHPEVQWLHFDVSRRIKDVLIAPEHYGFHNIKDTCYNAVTEKPKQKTVLKQSDGVKLNADVCDGYLFFDPVHPTAPAHKLLAEHIKALLDDAGIEFAIKDNA